VAQLSGFITIFLHNERPGICFLKNYQNLLWRRETVWTACHLSNSNHFNATLLVQKLVTQLPSNLIRKQLRVIALAWYVGRVFLLQQSAYFWNVCGLACVCEHLLHTLACRNAEVCVATTRSNCVYIQKNIIITKMECHENTILKLIDDRSEHVTACASWHLSSVCARVENLVHMYCVMHIFRCTYIYKCVYFVHKYRYTHVLAYIHLYRTHVYIYTHTHTCIHLHTQTQKVSTHTHVYRNIWIHHAQTKDTGPSYNRPVSPKFGSVQ